MTTIQTENNKNEIGFSGIELRKKNKNIFDVVFIFFVYGNFAVFNDFVEIILKLAIKIFVVIFILIIINIKIVINVNSKSVDNTFIIKIVGIFFIINTNIKNINTDNLIGICQTGSCRQ